MNVILINGSPHIQGSGALALQEMKQVFEQYDIEVEVIHIGNQAIRGCIACNHCQTHKQCVFQDQVNEVAKKFEEADGIVVSSPVYYASANATLIAFLDRLFIVPNLINE